MVSSVVGGRGVLCKPSLPACLSFPTSAHGVPTPGGGAWPRSLSPDTLASRSPSATQGPAHAALHSPGSRSGPATRMRSAPQARRASPRFESALGSGRRFPRGAPAPVPPYLGRRAHSRQAGGRAAAGRRGARRRPARPASGPWRPGRGGAAAAGMPGTRAGSGLPAARPGPGPWREGGKARDLGVPEMPRLKLKPRKTCGFEHLLPFS